MTIGYKKVLIVSLLAGGSVLLVLFWLRFVNVSKLSLANFTQLYDIENQNAGYHSVKLTATFFTLLLGILNVNRFTHVRVERFIRQRPFQYFRSDLMRIVLVTLAFCIWFYGIDALLLLVFIPKKLLLTPLVIATLVLRFILAIGYYVLACEFIYWVNLVTKQFVLALFLAPVVMIFSLQLCTRMNWSHPLTTLDTFGDISLHGLDLVPIAQGGIQLVCLLLLLFYLNVWQLGKRDFL